MEAIRTKDRLFLALVVPAALVAAYVWLWRTDAVRQIGALAQEDAALVAVGDFPSERLRAERQLKAARDERAAEETRPMPAAKVKAQAGEDVATRERAVLGVFRLAGLSVERCAAAEDGDAAARDVLNRTGLRPEPVCRRYAVVGSYPQLCAALRLFAAREMAVVPDRVAMPAPGHWSLVLWL